MVEIKADNAQTKPVEPPVSLVQMQSGQKGTIVEIKGGSGLVQRLQALGIAAGKEITKTSSQFLKGPVILRQNRTEIALGFGMASKVFVQVNGKC